MTDILEIEARCASLKEKLGKKVAIVGHHYQKDSVIKFCDHVGDSLELIQKIPALDARYIIFCGVSFMGETAAMLAREDQKILLPAAASSPRTVNMPSAAQLEKTLATLKEHGHNFIPLVYVNSSVELKALTGRMGGAMCTSSNLRRMLQWAFKKSAHVLFVPDQNLGRNTARQMGLKDEDVAILKTCEDGIDLSVDQPLDRHLLLWPGYCSIHEAYTPAMLNDLRFSSTLAAASSSTPRQGQRLSPWLTPQAPPPSSSARLQRLQGQARPTCLSLAQNSISWIA